MVLPVRHTYALSWTADSDRSNTIWAEGQRHSIAQNIEASTERQVNRKGPGLIDFFESGICKPGVSHRKTRMKEGVKDSPPRNYHAIKTDHDIMSPKLIRVVGYCTTRRGGDLCVTRTILQPPPRCPNTKPTPSASPQISERDNRSWENCVLLIPTR